MWEGYELGVWDRYIIRLLSCKYLLVLIMTVFACEAELVSNKEFCQHCCSCHGFNISLTILADSIYNILIFLAKATYFFSKISDYCILNHLKQLTK